MRKPNILFAIADDASHMSAYGHTMVNTPNFDNVARKGLLFNNSFTTNPKCAPSRASILTGMHTWQLEEACTHWCYFPSKFPLYPDLLEKAGYHIGYTGKGWAPGDWEKNGLKRNPAGPVYNHKLLTPPENTLICDIDYTENFKDFLKEKAADQPFYFWYGAKEPHRQYNSGEGIRGGKHPEDVKVPPYLPDDMTVKNDFCDYAYEIEWFDMHLGHMIEHLEAIGELDNTIIVVTSDNGAPFPRIKGQMYEDDFNLPLAICWKNGIKGPRIIDDIVSFIDFAPTFLEVAGVDIPSEWPGQSLTDIFYAEKDKIVNPNRNRAIMGRERHDLGRENDLGYPVRCIRTPDFLYIRNFEPSRWPAGDPETWYPNCDGGPTKRDILQRHAVGENFYYNLSFGKRPLEELYDIRTDSACMHNLAHNKNYEKIKAELWEELQQLLKDTNDPRIFGNGDIFDSYTYAKDPKHSWAHLMAGDWEMPKH